MSDRNKALFKRIEDALYAVDQAGLKDEANLLSNAAYGFLKTVSAFDNGYPYLDNPEEQKREHVTNKGAMHVTNYTITHWAKELGLTRKTPEQVLAEAAADAHYHATHTS